MMMNNDWSINDSIGYFVLNKEYKMNFIFNRIWTEQNFIVCGTLSFLLSLLETSLLKTLRIYILFFRGHHLIDSVEQAKRLYTFPTKFRTCVKPDNFFLNSNYNFKYLVTIYFCIIHVLFLFL